VLLPCSSATTGPTSVGRLTLAATKAQWPLMMTITWVYAVLAIALAVNVVVVVSAISKLELEEPHGSR
jgi:hypothetical protein